MEVVVANFRFRSIDEETKRGRLFTGNLLSVSYGVQHHCEDDHIVCIVKVGISGVVFSAKVWAAGNSVVEPEVNCNVEKV